MARALISNAEPGPVGVEEVGMGNQQPLWSPSKEAQQKTPLYQFIGWCAGRFGRSFPDYDAFYAWSIVERAEFWSAVWHFCGVKGEPGDRALIDGEDMLAARFFRMRR